MSVIFSTSFDHYDDLTKIWGKKMSVGKINSWAYSKPSLPNSWRASRVALLLDSMNFNYNTEGKIELELPIIPLPDIYINGVNIRDIEKSKEDERKLNEEIDSLEKANTYVNLLTEDAKAFIYQALYLDGMRIDRAESIIRKVKDRQKGR